MPSIMTVAVKCPISVVIIAKNEESCIGRCLSSIEWADEAVVVDSGSTDRTREIATEMGAKVIQQDWLGWAKQKDFGVSVAKYDWVLVLDADEIVTSEMAESISSTIVGLPDARNAYAFRHPTDFLGILTLGASRNPLETVRLFNRQNSWFDTSLRVHEKVVCKGKISLLQGDLVHWRGRTMAEYMQSINFYTTIEAEILNEKNIRSTPLKMFVRPILQFVWCFIIHRQYRYGSRGIILALLVAMSDYFRYAKLWEIQNTSRMLHPPLDLYPYLRSNKKSGKNVELYTEKR
jgi:(heptosyl)LPS beta-1,4-glucosyltransferase